MLIKYKAIKDGKITLKKIEAEDEQSVVKYLKDNDYIPIEVSRSTASLMTILKSTATKLNKVSQKDVVDFTRQLAIMLNAGLTIIDALGILKKQIKKVGVLKIVETIDEEIRGGNSFSVALKKFPEVFSNMYISLVRAGEASGKLSDILLKLAESLEKDRETKGKLKSALVYPVIIISAMIVVVFIMVTFVLPRLLKFYKEFNVKLPLSTQILISVSSFLTVYWPLIVGTVIVLVLSVYRYSKTKQGKIFYDSIILRVPVIGEIFKMASLVDSTRTLSLLVGAGVSILESLNIIIDTTDNVIFQDAYKGVLKSVERGTSFGSALENENVFPIIFVQMAMVGESTGHLDSTLMRLSKYFEFESEIAIRTMTVLIEPVILIILGLGVGILVISVITPIYNFTSSFQ